VNRTVYLGKKSQNKCCNGRSAVTCPVNMTERKAKVKSIQRGTYGLLSNGYRVPWGAIPGRHQESLAAPKQRGGQSDQTDLGLWHGGSRGPLPRLLKPS
jgi:hypothetical protein